MCLAPNRMPHSIGAACLRYRNSDDSGLLYLHARMCVCACVVFVQNIYPLVHPMRERRVIPRTRLIAGAVLVLWLAPVGPSMGLCIPEQTSAVRHWRGADVPERGVIRGCVAGCVDALAASNLTLAEFGAAGWHHRTRGSSTSSSSSSTSLPPEFQPSAASPFGGCTRSLPV